MNRSDPVPKYLTAIQNVREVTLVGSADLEFWQDHLTNERLFPYNNDGQAELIINAVELKWTGIIFRELVISLPVCESRDGHAMDGYYLVQAFNSSRLLALSERVFFRTPYAHGAIEVNSQGPAFVSAGNRRSSLFRAEMSGMNACLGKRDATFEGKTFIQNNRYYHLILSGVVEIYSFLPGQDTLEIETEASNRAFRWLVESNFTGKEWRIRRNGTHARSRTYGRK